MLFPNLFSFGSLKQKQEIIVKNKSCVKLPKV